MIRDLDGLVGYTNRIADAVPAIAGEIRIVRPGCTTNEVDEIASILPGVPESYLDVVRALSINGISIGYFQLSPGASRKTRLADKLRKYNDPRSAPDTGRMQRYGSYRVGSWEADPIAVVHGGGAFRPGQVLWFRFGNPELGPSVLGDTFAQFLIIAANLDEVRSRHANSKNANAARREFEGYITSVSGRRQDDMSEAWKAIANVVLQA